LDNNKELNSYLNKTREGYRSKMRDPVITYLTESIELLTPLVADKK